MLDVDPEQLNLKFDKLAWPPAFTLDARYTHALRHLLDECILSALFPTESDYDRAQRASILALCLDSVQRHQAWEYRLLDLLSMSQVLHARALIDPQNYTSGISFTDLLTIAHTRIVREIDALLARTPMHSFFVNVHFTVMAASAEHANAVIRSVINGTRLESWEIVQTDQEEEYVPGADPLP